MSSAEANRELLGAGHDTAELPATASPWTLKLGFATLGLINNLAYCVVIGAANNVTKDFDSPNGIGKLCFVTSIVNFVV